MKSEENSIPCIFNIPEKKRTWKVQRPKRRPLSLENNEQQKEWPKLRLKTQAKLKILAFIPRTM